MEIIREADVDQELSDSPETYNRQKLYHELDTLTCKLLGVSSVEDIDPNDPRIRAFTSPRRPNPDNPSEIVYLPTTESTPAQLSFDKDQIKDFFARAKKGGFLGYADGIKINSIDTSNPLTGPRYADASVAGNIEILLRTAKKLDLEIVIPTYSGDEIVFIVAPQEDDSRDRQELLAKFKETRQSLTTEYYNQSFFAPVHKILEGLPTPTKPGMHARYVNPDSAKVYKPAKYNQVGTEDQIEFVKDDTQYLLHLKSALGGIIDATQDHPHTIDQGSSAQLLAELEKIMLLQAEIWNSGDEGKQKILLSATESSIFPRDLEVKPIDQLEHDLANTKKASFFIRLADLRLKATNEDSHVKGDFELIATMRLLQRFLRKNDIKNPHENIDYYQHNGSFLVRLNPKEYHAIKDILDTDPMAFNNFISKSDLSHSQLEGQDLYFRAHPLVAITTQVFDPKSGKMIATTYNPDSPPNDLFQDLIQPLKEEQLFNETQLANHLLTQTLALPVIHLLARQITSVSKHSRLFLFLQQQLEYRQYALDYFAQRPQNKAKARKIKTQQRLKRLQNLLHLSRTTRPH